MATTYTVIRQALTGDSADVIIEFDIPLGVNAAGVAWRQIVLELYSVRSDPAEFIPSLNERKYRDSNYTMSLLDGEKVELPLTVTFPAGSGNGAKVAAIEAAVTAKVAQFSTEFVTQYDFYGYTGTV